MNSTKHEVWSLLEVYYELEVTDIKHLVGYENANYLIKTIGQNFVLKTHPFSEDLYRIVQGESKVLQNLGSSNLKLFPKPIKSVNKKFVEKININGERKILRMLTFLEGELLVEMEHSKELFASLGTALAEMDLALQGMSILALKARQSEWDNIYFLDNKKYLKDIGDVKDRKIVDHFFYQFEENVRPVFSELRKSLIHNDANDWNIIARNNQICGIFDFGDMAHSFLINELAVSIAYMLGGKDDPLDWAGEMVKAYHKVLPLQAVELDVLYYLIAARICTSVCQSAHNKKLNPDNDYLSVSEKPMWELLYKLLKISPLAAKKTFRLAAGFEVDLQSEHQT